MGVYYPQSAVRLRIRWEIVNTRATVSEDFITEMIVQCKQVKVAINDYTQADTFSLEIDYKNFPFDPRCIRSVSATIAMEDMGAIFDNHNGLKVVQIRHNSKNPEDDNVVFLGFADEEKISFDDTKRTVKLEGRDYTALLIDKKYDKGAVSLESTVDVVISSILASAPETEKITVDNQIGEELPIISKFWGEKDLLSGKRNSRKDETYWDVIQDIVRRAGLIAYIELDKLVLAKPRNIYDKTKANKFVYGRNIKNLEFSRKIGRKRGFNIMVRSLNLNTKEVLEAKIPLEATTKWSEETGIGNSEVKIKKIRPDGTKGATGIKEEEETAPYISFIVADVSSKDHLIEVGQQVYEEIGRQEIEGSFETKEMFTADGKNKKFNLLKCRNGTPVQLFIEQGDMKVLSNFRAQASAVEKKNRQIGKAEKAVIANYLISRGWDPLVATIFAERYNNFANIFYTRAVEFTIDNTSGFNCKIDFINFIENNAGKRPSD